MDKKKRVVLLLASYDYESLHLTLQSLNKTIDADEKVVIILNGKRGIRSAIVEDVARQWAKGNALRYVVKPLNYGGHPYHSILEVLQNFPLLQEAEFICKIDDDLIPIRFGWVDNLHQNYLQVEKQNGAIGFTTSLINNNTWGFPRIVHALGKQEEYSAIMNYQSISGDGVLEAGQTADGLFGTVWQYPYLAKWVHSFTLCNLPGFVEKTKELSVEEINLETHYSIGCLFMRKNLWLSLSSLGSNDPFDELLLHEYCKKHNLRKFAVMNEPMGHLFYGVQRLPNRPQLPDIRASLASYWNEESFRKTFDFDSLTMTEIVLENHLFGNDAKLKEFEGQLHELKWNSTFFRFKHKVRSVKQRIFKV